MANKISSIDVYSKKLNNVIFTNRLQSMLREVFAFDQFRILNLLTFY